MKATHNHRNPVCELKTNTNTGKTHTNKTVNKSNNTEDLDGFLCFKCQFFSENKRKQKQNPHTLTDRQ